jgi:hypothetical protein
MTPSLPQETCHYTRKIEITFPVCMGLSGGIILFVKFWLLAIGNVLGFKAHLLVAFFW